MRGYRRRRGWSAWHIALLGRVKEFPALRELTGERSLARPLQTPAQQISVLRQWKAALRAKPS